jgi:outer membrane receptor protein involved in Fe transport
MRNLQMALTTGAGSTLLLSVGLVIAPPATAQAQSKAPLEEIIVTAQKRTEVLSEVPMSITVLGGDTLESQRATNFQDLVSLVPGFSVNTEGNAGVSRITLRGINTGGVASTVGVYVDDVPFGSSSGLANAAVLSGDFDTFDLARIEVLRGPQGTLYGASSLGGVLKYVTNQPSTEGFEARGQLSVESVDGGGTGYAGTGVVNVPVSDTFAVRATGFYRYDDGFIDSIGGNPIPSLDPNTFTLDPTVPVVEGARVEDDINSVDRYGGRISALFEPSDRFSLNLTALLQNINSDSADLVEADPLMLEPVEGGNVRSRYHSDYTDIEYQIYSATLNWDFGGASLQSVTSYSEFEHEFQVDVAANTLLTGGIPLASLVTAFFGDRETRPLSAVQQQITSTDKFTQELRLVSDESDTLEWLVGLYYTDEDSGIDPQNFLAVEAGTDTVANDLPLLVQGTVLSTYEEMALFANATWHITPKFDLSFGARASDNEQEASQVFLGPLVGGSQVFEDAQSSESPFTWSVSPRYEFSDDLSVFARVATGFRPGGPNVIPPNPPDGFPETYDADELTSYELGLRVDSPDGDFALDVTAFYLDWEDVQLLGTIGTPPVGFNGNGGTAVSKGVEFAVTSRPIDGLILSLNGAYTDAYLTQDTPDVVGGLDGDPLPFVPEWSFGADGSYEWEVMGDALAYVGASVAFVDDRPTEFNNLAPDGSVREAEGYTTLNLRTGIDFGRWSLELYGRNLSDEEGVTRILGEGWLPNGNVGLGLIRPRTYGLSLGASF